MIQFPQGKEKLDLKCNLINFQNDILNWINFEKFLFDRLVGKKLVVIQFFRNIERFYISHFLSWKLLIFNITAKSEALSMLFLARNTVLTMVHSLLMNMFLFLVYVSHFVLHCSHKYGRNICHQFRAICWT